MGMSVQEIATLKTLMEYEASRKEPPKGFPSLPDIPAGRYIDPRFFELEKEILMVETEGESLAVDSPADIESVENALKHKHQ